MKAIWQFFSRFGSPKFFFELTQPWVKWILILSLTLMVVGLYGGLWLAPADYQQGNSFRIIYIHVPTAFLSMAAYTAMAVFSAIFLIWRTKTADIMARSCAPIGAVFCFLALLTGSLWGVPTWNTWWTWDARLTSELVLLFLYFGYMGLVNAIENPLTASRAGALMAIVGVVNIPIIHYSVVFWNSLHQGSTLSLTEKPKMPVEMLWPLLTMIAAVWLLFFVFVLYRAHNEILFQERKSQWVKNWVSKR